MVVREPVAGNFVWIEANKALRDELSAQSTDRRNEEAEPLTCEAYSMCTIPRRSATFTAAVRSLTFSLAKMCLR